MMMKTVADTSKTALFQMRINPCVRKRVEAVYADCGLTLTDAINLFLQQSLNVEGLPFTVTSKPKPRRGWTHSRIWTTDPHTGTAIPNLPRTATE